MAELADALDSKSSDGNIMRVQVSPRAQSNNWRAFAICPSFWLGYKSQTLSDDRATPAIGAYKYYTAPFALIRFKFASIREYINIFQQASHSHRSYSAGNGRNLADYIFYGFYINISPNFFSFFSYPAVNNNGSFFYHSAFN